MKLKLAGEARARFSGAAVIVIVSLLVMGILPNGVDAADKLVVKDSTGNNNVFVVTDDAAAATDPIATVKGEVRPQYLVLGAVGNANPLGNGRMDFVRAASNGVSQLLFGTGTPPTHTLNFQMGMFNNDYFQIRVANQAGKGITIAPGAGNVGVGTTVPTHMFQVGANAYSDGTGWYSNSSRQYKDNIRELNVEEALEALQELNPVTFRYKGAPEQQHVGFIAEDVPELVATKDRQGLNPMDIVAVLTKVVKEQEQTLREKSERVERQQKTLEEQIASIRRLMEEVEKLRAEMNRLNSKEMAVRAVIHE